MPEDKNCTLHPSLHAVGSCSRCKRPFCLDCLDMETGSILCPDCKKGKVVMPAPATPVPSPMPTPVPVPKPAAAAPTPPSMSPPGMGGSPLNFKNKGLDDDPLGLLGGGPSSGAPKMEASKPIMPPPMAPKPVAAPPPLSNPVPTGLPLDLAQLGTRSVTPPAASKPSMDLDDLMGGSAPSLPKAPVAPLSPKPFEGAPTPTPFSPGPMPGLSVEPVNKQKQAFSLVKIWAKYLVKQAYHIFDPIAKKLKIPTYALLGGTGLIVFVLFVDLVTWLDRPAIAIAKTVPPIHIIKVTSGQISEMDVTAYSELQNQLQTLGFSPLIQMTVPQLPSPNYFDVAIKEDVGAYSEILKLPGQIAPHLSFVTVFGNGVWCSTNGWQGTNQELEFLNSEYDPNLPVDQLYVKHVQRVEKLKKDKDLQVQAMSENRYIAALSDHLRWFLVKKDIQGYQADFNLWH